MAQVICGLLLKRVVENLQDTMHEALRLSELVIMMLATSAPGRMMHLKGTDSAPAGPDRKPLINAKKEIDDRDAMRLARAISLPPFSVRH